jgi:transposase
MPKAGLRKINRYSDTFRATAVKLAHVKGVKIKDVAESLDIHSFMLSRWIK